MKISEIHCKSAMVKSGIYGVDYAVNPYTGCEHNCVYCYATFMKKYSHHPEPWGSFVDVKINAPSVLKKQVKRIKEKRVLFSSVTDAYQPLEEKYEVTRNCLRQLQGTSLFVSILTKSALVTRDIDILQNLTCEVGFTFTTLEDAIRIHFEPNSSSVPERLGALKEVAEAGVSTYAFLGPILPFLSDSQEAIDEMFDVLQDHVSYVIVDKMNFYSIPWKRIRTVLQSWNPDLLPRYNALQVNNGYAKTLRKRILKAAQVPVEFCF